MDDIEKHWTEQRQKKYRELYKGNFSGTGMFVMRKRKQLLGIEPKTKAVSESAKKTALANFNYDVRENAKMGLIDLQLFIETADAKDVDAVMTRETIENIFSTLLSLRLSKGAPKPVIERIKIAQLLGELGFEYLRKESRFVTKSQNQIFDDAIDASRQLAYMMIPEKERSEFPLWSKESRI